MPTINGPCRVCGIRIQRESLADLYCGPACKSLHEAREASSKPGDPYYHPVTGEARAAHRKAMRAKQWA